MTEVTDQARAPRTLTPPRPRFTSRFVLPRRPDVFGALVGAGLLMGGVLGLLALTFGVLKPLIAENQAIDETLRLILFGVLASVLLFLVVALVALTLILALRKYLGRVQNRYGPIHTGPWGTAQTLADAIKLLVKEDITPARSDRLVFTLAPAIVFVSTFVLLAVIPFAEGWVLADVEVGLLFLIGASTLSAYGVLMAGWSVANKYGLLGGLRAAAQVISYEVPLAISFLSVALWAGSLNLTEIVNAQAGLWFIVPLFVPFVVYMVAALAELKSTPFDLPEAESELIAGYHTEYSGMRFAFFFVAEFAEIFILSALVTVLFLGGWHGPIIPFPAGAVGDFLTNLQQAMWFLVKTTISVYFFMWVRATLPRFRDDQLMEVCWKVLIPLSFVGLAITAALRFFTGGFGL